MKDKSPKETKTWKKVVLTAAEHSTLLGRIRCIVAQNAGSGIIENTTN